MTVFLGEQLTSIGVGFDRNKVPATMRKTIPRWLSSAIHDAEKPRTVARRAFAASMWMKGYGRDPSYGLTPVTGTDSTKTPAYVGILYDWDHPFWKDPNYPQRQRDRNNALAHPPFWRTQHTTYNPLEIAGQGLKIAGHIIKAPIDAANAIADVAGSIPVLGDVTRIVGEAATGPLKLAKDIASGARLDRALLKSIKDQVRIAKEAAPYAQAVVSMVPGVGSGVSAAIGAGVALAEGKGIDEAAKAAVRSALPGGPIAAAGFDAAMKVAKGENVGKAALESARNLVPEGLARKAFDIGLAVASGQNIQQALVQGFAKMGADQLRSVAGDWIKAVVSKPDVLKAFSAIPKDVAPGYALAMGALGHEGISPQALAILRSKLSPQAQAGFDLALASQKKNIPWLPSAKELTSVAVRRPPTLRTGTAPAAIRRPPTLRTGTAPAAVPAPRKPPTLRTSKAPGTPAPKPAQKSVQTSSPQIVSPAVIGPYP